MANKDKKQDDLDTETTFADMNVEGFRWYDPNRKKNGGKKDQIKLTRKEYWAMVRGAFAAMLPMFACILIGMLAIFLLAFLWLKL
jgi:hypothetical protein